MRSAALFIEHAQPVPARWHIAPGFMCPWQHAIVHPCGAHANPRATSAKGVAISAIINATDCIRRIISECRSLSSCGILRAVNHVMRRHAKRHKKSAPTEPSPRLVAKSNAILTRPPFSSALFPPLADSAQLSGARLCLVLPAPSL
jgi:hypothetical protein